MTNLVALETKAEMDQAIATWQSQLRQGADLLDEDNGNEVRWYGHSGIWAVVPRLREFSAKLRYWNPLGLEPERFRENVIVEINPPEHGTPRGQQGLIARDTDASTWILHKGGLTLPGIRTTKRDFDKLTRIPQVNVSFSNGKVSKYYKVANLHESAAVFEEQLASYIFECKKLRVYYAGGESGYHLENQVFSVEGAVFPEAQGDYAVAPRGAVVARRRHADVWKALKEALEKAGVRHSNARIGRYGPDLWTLEQPRCLFEIKTECGSSDIHQAVGQLLIYENLLGDRFRKILLVPEPEPKELSRAVRALGIDLVPFSWHRRTAHFDSAALSAILGDKDGSVPH